MSTAGGVSWARIRLDDPMSTTAATCLNDYKGLKSKKLTGILHLITQWLEGDLSNYSDLYYMLNSGDDGGYAEDESSRQTHSS